MPSEEDARLLFEGTAIEIGTVAASSISISSGENFYSPYLRAGEGKAVQELSLLPTASFSLFEAAMMATIINGNSDKKKTTSLFSNLIDRQSLRATLFFLEKHPRMCIFFVRMFVVLYNAHLLGDHPHLLSVCCVLMGPFLLFSV